jgi:hypothetical protein
MFLDSLSPVLRHPLMKCGFAIALGGLALGVSTSAVAAGKTEGFVISSFMTSVYNDAQSCPEGLNDGPDNKDVIARVPDPELRAKIAKILPEDLARFMTHRGPNWADVCHLEAAVSDPSVPSGPLSVPDPGMKTVQGKISYGENLDGTQDGAATDKTCGHEKFAGPNGEKAVDNQLFRVLGCTVGFGPQGWFRIYGSQQMRDGDRTILVQVSNVEDLRNSDNVKVTIYDGADSLVKDPKGEILHDVSYRAVQDQRRRATTTGRIVDGVLTTDPVDLTVWKVRYTGAQIPTTIQSARLKLTFKPDGSGKGVLVGYENWQDIYRLLVHTGANDELPLFFTCPGVYRAFQRFADGDKDSKTGQCRAVSASYDIEVTPAHIIAPSTPDKTVQAGGKTASVDAPRSVRAAQVAGN